MDQMRVSVLVFNPLDKCRYRALCEVLVIGSRMLISGGSEIAKRARSQSQALSLGRWSGVTAFFAVLAAFVVNNLFCVEVAKYFFYKIHTPITVQPLQRDHVHRLAARWSHPQPLHLQESSPNARQHRVRFHR